jgi:hypothetical protein
LNDTRVAFGARFCMIFGSPSGFRRDHHAQEHDPEKVCPAVSRGGFDFPKEIMFKSDTPSSNPAAGRNNGQGARDDRKDGRHPKDNNHGRIAGRRANNVPPSCAWFLCFGAPVLS